MFVPTRRPAPPAVPAAQESAKPRMQKGQFVLTGTAVVEQKSVAFLRESAGGKSRSVRVGETINGLARRRSEAGSGQAHDGRGQRGAPAQGRCRAAHDRPTGPACCGGRARRAGCAGRRAARRTGHGRRAGRGGGPAAAAPGTSAPSQAGYTETEASLLERRRAARAAQAAAEAAARSGQTVPPALPSAPNTTTPATPAATDPAWAEVYRRMQQPRR